MIKTTFCVFIFSSVLLANLAFCNSGLEYWLSFRGCTPAGECGGQHLMKIDQHGNVLFRATRVVANPKYESSAILKRGRWIDMWLLSYQAVSRRDPYVVSRAVIDSQTLKLVSIKKSPLRSGSLFYIHTTQKPANNFVAIQSSPKDSTDFLAFRLSSSTGQVISLGQNLTQEFGDCEGCATALAPDGKVFLFTDLIPGNVGSRQILLQMLNSALKPLMKPQFIVKNRFVDVMDVSNPLSSGKRYVLYSPHTLSAYYPLFLQQVNAETGKAIGKPVLVAPMVGFNKAAVVEPSGKFVVYLGERIPFQGGTLNDVMVFQSLDSFGKPVGKKKILDLGNNLDLLKD